MQGSTEFRKTPSGHGASKLKQAILVASVVGVTLLLILISLAALPVPDGHESYYERRSLRVHDRPVMERLDQVWDARMTGVCEFSFDGEHYRVRDMPKGYVDYSSWCVRMT